MEQKTACNAKHIGWLEELESYAQKSYETRVPFFGKERERIIQAVEQSRGAEQIFLKFLYGTLPIQDIGDCDVTVLKSYCSHACKLLEEMPWCEEMPGHLFVQYVLYPRINSEFIEDCRLFFYDQLRERVRGLSMEQAVLEVNYWCAEHVSYESSDDRTASPLTVYRCGKGRCGEESTFAVTALRSVGIPARQVYVPKWSHCDDNHAWVETWTGDGWHFLGACEPEEVLDKGWFTHASSRAVLVHSRTFSDFGGELLGECIGQNGPVRYYNDTMSYGLAKRVRIRVVDENHVPVDGASVSAEILNMAQYCEILTMETDRNGCIQADLGMGSVHLLASKDGKWAQSWILVGEESEEVELILECFSDAGAQGDVVLEEHYVKAPLDYPMHPAVLTREQKERNRIRLHEADQMREARLNAYYIEERAAAYPEEMEILREAGGNFEELYRFLSADGDPDRRRMLHSLTKKDWRDAKAWILEDHLREARAADAEIASATTAIPESETEGLSEELTEFYSSYVLNPRIYLEQIGPYRSFIKKFYDAETLEAFRKEPQRIWDDIQERIVCYPQFDDGDIFSTPIGCLKLGQGNEMSRKILFVAVCRTLGTPARIHEVDREAEYYDGTWHRVLNRAEKTDRGEDFSEVLDAVLLLKGSSEQLWNYAQNWSIGKWDGRNFRTLNYGGVKFNDLENGLSSLRLQLAPGKYRLITANRMPNGNQNAMEWRFCLASGEERDVNLSLMEGNVKDMLMFNPLGDLELQKLDGETISAAEVTKGKDTVWAFLEEGKEPTEHVLNELLEQQENIKGDNIQILFLIRNKEALSNRTLQKVLKALPGIEVYISDFESQVEPLARRMYVDPDKLPLLIAVRDKMVGIYGCSGYHVGSVGLIWKLLRQGVQKA